MLEELTKTLSPSRNETLAKAFSRWGRSGFWALVVMGALPLIIMVYTLVFSGRPAGSTRSGLPLVQFFSTAGLVLLVFLAFWFHRYTRIAVRLQDPAKRPSDASLRKTVWTGVVAASIAILFSMLVLLLEVGTLLFYFLSAPQAGLPTVQTTGAAAATWVSAVDMMNLMSVILTLGGEIFALIFGLLLLFRTIQVPAEPAKGSH
ncbi:MAG: DUF3611 family protein [Desulfobacterales bacterium]|jgi:hypothetical protein|nr:DUF3611 family protein [Desulfobacterales bacterium]